MMSQLRVLAGFVLFSFAAASIKNKFPTGFDYCHRSDPEFDKCLTNAIDKSFRVLSTKGMPSVHLPPISPIRVDKMTIKEGNHLFDLVQYYDDLKIHGFGDQTVTNAHFDFDNKVLTFTSELDEMIHEAKYDFDGKLFMLPLKGNGDIVGTLKQVTVKHTITFAEIIRNGIKYYKIVSYDIDLVPQDAHAVIDNLFDGDKLAGDMMNKIVNDNWRELYADVKPEVERAYAAVFRKLADQFFKVVPADEIFPQ